MSYKRNWPVILATLDEDDLHMLWALGVTTNEAMLEGLRRGHPQFFYPDGEEPKEKGRPPLSVIMEAAEHYSRRKRNDSPTKNWDRHFLLSGAFKACPHLELKVTHEWTNNDVPYEVLEDLVNQRFKAGMVVRLEGVQYMVLDIVFRRRAPEIGDQIKKRPALFSLSLVRASDVEMTR